MSTETLVEAKFILNELHRMLDRAGELLLSARKAHEAEMEARAKAVHPLQDVEALRKAYDDHSKTRLVPFPHPSVSYWGGLADRIPCGASGAVLPTP